MKKKKKIFTLSNHSSRRLTFDTLLNSKSNRKWHNPEGPLSVSVSVSSISNWLSLFEMFFFSQLFGGVFNPLEGEIIGETGKFIFCFTIGELGLEKWP